MKTVDTDIAAFLRRNENLELRLHFDGKRFHVKSPSIEQHAAYLSDALEHTAEEYRRRANAMDPIRDDGRGKAGDCVKAPGAKPASNGGGGGGWVTVTLSPSITTAPAVIPRGVVNSISYAPNAPAPQINGVIPTCKACGNIPAYALHGGSISCSCGGAWPANTLDVYRFSGHSGSWRFDGSTWSKVAP